MKVYSFFILLLAVTLFGLVLSCKDIGQEKSTDGPLETFDQKIRLNPEDSVAYRNALPPIWEYDRLLEIPVKVREVDKESFTAQKLIDLINFQYEGKIYLKYKNISGDTLYVKIDSSDYLTQQMGTLGADAYLSTTTFTLTEPNYINVIYFDFTEGDHAIPGFYSREYFTDRK